MKDSEKRIVEDIAKTCNALDDTSKHVVLTFAQNIILIDRMRDEVTAE